MIRIDEKNVILGKNEYNENKSFFDKYMINLDNSKIKNKDPKIFYITFDNNKKNTIKKLKKLKKIKQRNRINGIEYEGYNIIGITENLNEEIINCIKAIYIENREKRYEYIYDTLCDDLDKIWSEKNPCKFENNICIFERNKSKNPRINGCCYSFWYRYFGSQIYGVHQCEHFDKVKFCTNKNLTCKLFVCQYLRKYSEFEININEILLIQVFFNIYQKIVIKNNFFIHRKELIKKLIKEEKRIKPILLYYACRDFLVYKNIPKEKRKMAKDYQLIYKRTKGLRK